MTSPHVEEARHILSRGIRDSMKLTPLLCSYAQTV